VTFSPRIGKKLNKNGEGKKEREERKRTETAHREGREKDCRGEN